MKIAASSLPCGVRGKLMSLDRRMLRLALVLAWIAAPLAARAADGVLEINQACAAAGCFAGDSAGFPVTLRG